MNEETVAVEDDVSSGAEAHDNVQSVVTQQVSTGVSSCSTDDNLMHYIEDSRHFCDVHISVMFLPVKLTRIHSGTRSQEESESTSQSKKSKVEIKCLVYGEIYPTKYQLQKHQTEQNYKMGRGRPKKK